MRILTLLVLLAPTLAIAKPHPRAKARSAPVVVAAAAAAPVAASRPATVEQAEDDERPGSRQAKK